MRFRQFHRLLRDSASLPVTRDEDFVRRVAGPAAAEPAIVRRKPFSRLAFSLSSVAAVFAAVVFGFYGLHPAAVLTVDVNPSVQISINHFNRVIGFKALNDDADVLIGRVDWFNRTPENVLVALYQELVEAGFIETDDVLLLGLSGITAAEGETYQSAFADALSAANLLYMNEYEADDATVILRASQAFQESADAETDERSAFWDGVYDAATEGMNADVVTTTAPMMTTTAGVPATDDAVVVSQLPLSASDLADLAASFGVSVAKLRLAIAVFNAMPAFQTTTDLYALALLPISELAALYNAID